MKVGFEYRWDTIMKKLNVEVYETYGNETIDEQCVEVRTKTKIYWFILSGATFKGFVYKLVHTGKL